LTASFEKRDQGTKGQFAYKIVKMLRGRLCEGVGDFHEHWGGVLVAFKGLTFCKGGRDRQMSREEKKALGLNNVHKLRKWENKKKGGA